MLGYGGLNRAEGRVTRIAHEWGTLRAVHDRGEIPPPVLLPRLTAMTDELAAVAASAPHPSLALARDTAADLRHRIALDVVARAPRPLVLPGVTCPGAGTGTGTDHPVRHLPDLWRDHRHDPVRRPAHPDAVGQPGTDGVPLDGEGGRLPDLFRRHWVDTAVAAAADPDVPLAEVDALMDRTAAVVRRHGATAAAVAALRARVLLGTGRIEQARELLDLTDEHAPGTAVTRATVALLRGDLDTLLRILGHGEDTGRAGTGEWVLLTAASLVPLAHVVDAPTTVDRVAGVLAVATGVPDLVPAVLHVVEYLALAGAPEPALALLVRTVDVTDVPAAAAPALRAVADAGRSADPAADLGGRRLIAGGPTVRELADDLSAGLGLRAVHADARNGRAMWTTDVPASRDYPVPPLDAADLADVPGLVDLALPAALPVGPRVVPSAAVELPGVGPVDPASLDAADALCATVMYTLLGLADAADFVVDRMRCLTPDDGAPVVLDIAAEFVRRADCATGHGAGCFACARTVAATSAGLLAEIDRTVRDCACAGTAPDAPARVRVMLDRRPTAHPLVRRLIDLDVLLSGALPDREAVDCAVRGLWTAVRLLPRAVPLVGGSLLGVQEDVRRGLVDATVVTTLTTVAVALPVPPAVSPLGLVDHVADLADLAGALVGAGAYREACAVTAAGLDAVGGNWAASGVASGCTRGEVGADDDGPVRLLRARSAALAGLGNTVVAAECAEAAARAAEYRGRWRLAEACRVDAAARQG